MKKKDNIPTSRIMEIIHFLDEEYPKAKTALNYINPLQLLISTILSAQCTDKRVKDHNQLVDRSIQRAYEIMTEFGFEYDMDNEYFKLGKRN